MKNICLEELLVFVVSNFTTILNLVLSLYLVVLDAQGTTFAVVSVSSVQL